MWGSYRSQQGGTNLNVGFIQVTAGGTNLNVGFIQVTAGGD
jgi:hypothetical protein